MESREETMGEELYSRGEGFACNIQSSDMKMISFQMCDV